MSEKYENAWMEVHEGSWPGDDGLCTCQIHSMARQVVANFDGFDLSGFVRWAQVVNEVDAECAVEDPDQRVCDLLECHHPFREHDGGVCLGCEAENYHSIEEHAFRKHDAGRVL